ncbi:helix-turn-helix domain-containing protein [Streptomyces similanensis]|uniref:HTH cro/C1-type domain-containing protein n=1 Tax=Streptomyces similanensis TaxID=1274988 RepID=A0ABP9KD82_9ACTN
MRKRGRVHDQPAELLAYRRRVGDRLRRARGRAGLTQQVLAERAGIDKQAISLIENAHSSPRLDTLWRIARALGEPIDVIVCDDRA